MSLLGRPSIHPLAFYAGKVCFGISLGLAILAMAGLDFSVIVVPALRVFGLIVAGIAAVILVLSFLHLGRSVRMGLSHDQTELKTAGLYRLSRNPMYLSVYLLCVASNLCVIHLLNAAATLAAILIHHQIILAEERFLSARFGPAWQEYRNRVGRYV